MKAVEIRVRKLGGFGYEVVGVGLMNKAFGPGTPLDDPAAVKGEQEGTRSMFAGAYGVLRNPAGHREIDYDDVTEAADAVHTASLLMRMLDRGRTPHRPVQHVLRSALRFRFLKGVTSDSNDLVEGLLLRAHRPEGANTATWKCADCCSVRRGTDAQDLFERGPISIEVIRHP